MSIAFVPLYIRYLGIESYGLIGVFALLQAWLALLDMGIKPTLGREMALFRAGARGVRAIRDLLRSMEIVALCIALVIVLGVGFASNWLANDWVHAEGIFPDDISNAFVVMGSLIALRFLEGIYAGAIIGLQKQVFLNAVTSFMATLRGLGALAVLAWISPTIGAFFLWQCMISILTLVILVTALYRILPRIECSGSFSLEALKSIRHFAGGMLGISFLALLLTQIDKIILSKLLSLSNFGYYTLAATLAGGLYMLAAPVTQAYAPRLSELHACGDDVRFAETYHFGSQLVCVIMGSLGLTLIVFSAPILKLWTQDDVLVASSSDLLVLLALGNLFNGLMWMPYQAQLAQGWTSLAVRVNAVAVIVFLPALLWVTPRYGALGAACVWVGLNFCYLMLNVHLMSRRILKREKWRWYLDDVFAPLFLGGLMSLFLLLLKPDQLGTLGQAIWLFTAAVSIMLSASLGASRIRHRLLGHLRRLRE